MSRWSWLASQSLSLHVGARGAHHITHLDRRVHRRVGAAGRSRHQWVGQSCGTEMMLDSLRGRRLVQTTPLNALDQLYLHLDREDEPWSVHLEIRVEGGIEAPRLEAAVREAARRHPIARARLGEVRATDVRYDWEIAEELDDVALQEVDGRDLVQAREELLSRTPRLDRPGPFSLLLAHDPAGD